MKITSAFLVALFLCLAFAGAAGIDLQPAAQKVCCKQMTGFSAKSACSHNTNGKGNDCGKQGCPMMLSCSICGFLKVDPLHIKPVLPNYIPKPVSLYKIGDLSSFHTANWKPPKSC